MYYYNYTDVLYSIICTIIPVGLFVLVLFLIVKAILTKSSPSTSNSSVSGQVNNNTKKTMILAWLNKQKAKGITHID